jgi:membrane-bound ClpP family serine protease
MPLVAVGVILIALGVLLALFVSTTVGIILAVVGAVAMIFGFITYGRGPGVGGDRVIVRDRPVRTTRVVEREREIL